MDPSKRFVLKEISAEPIDEAFGRDDFGKAELGRFLEEKEKEKEFVMVFCSLS